MKPQKYTISDPFDFDDWLQLARRDPAAFAQRRQAAITAYLDSLPPASRCRLRCLQWHIDMEIRRSRSPMGACIRLYRLMLESCRRQQAALDALLQGSALPNANQRAQVLPFTRDQS